MRITHGYWPTGYGAIFVGAVSATDGAIHAYPLLGSPGSIPFTVWWLPAVQAAIAVFFLVTGILTAWKQSKQDRWLERFQGGLCRCCGFDLRACTTVRCSECGAWHGKLPAKRFSHRRGVGPSICSRQRDAD